MKLSCALFDRKWANCQGALLTVEACEDPSMIIDVKIHEEQSSGRSSEIEIESDQDCSVWRGSHRSGSYKIRFDEAWAGICGSC